jgi:hypothetical protein
MPKKLSRNQEFLLRQLVLCEGWSCRPSLAGGGPTVTALTKRGLVEWRIDHASVGYDPQYQGYPIHTFLARATDAGRQWVMDNPLAPPPPPPWVPYVQHK